MITIYCSLRRVLPISCIALLLNLLCASSALHAQTSTRGGTLAGTAAPYAGTVDLTQEGTSDWAHWGLSNAASFDDKASGNSQISNITSIGPGNGNGHVFGYGNSNISHSWNDGTPTASASNVQPGIFAPAAGNGFSITVPADTSVRTLKLYLGGWNSTGLLQAHLSDGSAPDYTDASFSDPGGNTFASQYTLTYQAASPGQTLTISWTVQTAFDAAWGNVTLQAATLSSGGSFSTALTAPTGLTATGGSGQVALSWNSVSAATSYNVKRSTTKGGPYTTIMPGITSSSCTDTSVLGGTTYYYVVSAVNATGESNNSQEVVVTSGVTAPTGLSAAPGDGIVNLSWDAVTGADGYQLFRATTSGGPYSYVNSLNSASTSYVDRGPYGTLQNGTYYYVLVAQDNGSSSVYSNEAAVTLSIASPTNLTATAGDGTVSLSWSAVSGADYYQVFRATTSGGPYSYVNSFSSGTTSCVDRGPYGTLQNGTYYYVVLAGDNGGQSAYSNEASVALFINAPTNLTASPGDGVVNLSWNSVSGADYYQVFRATTSGGPYSYVNSFSSGTTSCVDRGPYGTLQNGTYYYVVLAGDNGGQSAYSNEAAVTLSIAAPTSLTASPGDGSVSLSWSAVTGADGYQLFRATTSGGPYTYVNSFGSGTTSYVDRNGYYGLQNGTYYYVLLASNNGGQSSYSNEAAVTLSIAVPTNLTATLASGGVSLAWDAVTGADYYQLFRASVSGGPYTYVNSFSSGTTSYVDRGGYYGYGLQNGTYYYVLLAGNNGGQSAYSNEASVTVIPIVTSITFNPNPVPGGNASTGTIYMNGISPTDCVVTLAGDNAVATLPASVTVPAGQSSTIFPFNTIPVTATTPVSVTATYAGLTAQATLSVVPLLGSIILNPNPVPGGDTFSGSVYLNGPAPVGDAVITLSSDNAAATVPATITVPAGYSTTGFTGTTSVVTTITPATIAAAYGGATVSQRLQVDPIEPVSLSILPSVVVGSDSAVGTVTLNRMAYNGGTVVALSCDSSSMIVPPTVTVPAGQVSVDFSVATTEVNQPVLGTVSASLSGKMRQASLTVQPFFTLAAIAANVNASVSGGALGSSTSSTLTLTAGAVTSMTLPVSLSLGSLPVGITGWLSAPSATVPSATLANAYNPATAGKTAITLYLVAGPNAVPGDYPITVMAAKDSYSVSTVIMLTVAP